MKSEVGLSLRADTAEDRVLKALNEGPKTAEQVVVELSLPLSTVRNALAVMVTSGMIEAPEKEGRKKLYQTIVQSNP